MNLLEENLFKAVINDDVNEVLHLLKKGANPNQITTQGQTSLGRAAHSGNTTILKHLLDYSCPSIRNEETNKRVCKQKRKKKYKNDVSSKLKPTCIDNGDRNRGYFVFIHEELTLSENDEPISLNSPNGSVVLSSSTAPSTPGSQGELEWDEEVCTVAKSTKEDETWSSLYRWYAEILECTGAALARAATVTYGIDQQDVYMRTAVHYAAERGHTAALNMLIDAGCKMNVASSDGITPLHAAVMNDRRSTAALLLNAGVNVNATTTEKLTALHIASTRGYHHVAELLIKHGANLECRDTSDRSALYLAAARGHYKLLALLITSGANVNTEEIHGYTALCEAVWQCSSACVEMLLMAGARLTHTHKLLHYAVLHKQFDIVKQLSQFGGVNLYDENGDTPLLIAAKLCDPQMAQILISYGAYPNWSNSITGVSVLHTAVDYCDDPVQLEKLLVVMLDHGVDMNATSLTGDTALNRAILLHKDDAVILLVRYGASVNACDLQACALDNLTLTSRRRSPKLTRLLIKAGHEIPSPSQCKPDNTKCETAASWLYEASRQPLSLCDILRIKIRKCKCDVTPMHWYIDKLMLPIRLKDFLMFKDDFD